MALLNQDRATLAKKPDSSFSKKIKNLDEKFLKPFLIRDYNERRVIICIALLTFQ
jgi:hypothetical protein